MYQEINAMNREQRAFWKNKLLDEMTKAEWELLCDGCALCCLQKLEDKDSGKVYYTDIACRLLDIATCCCSSYPNRTELISECLILTPAILKQFFWLPDTCAYRLIARYKPLPDWHHLISGSRETVHESGVSARRRVISETDVHPGEMQNHIVSRSEIQH